MRRTPVDFTEKDRGLKADMLRCQCMVVVLFLYLEGAFSQLNVCGRAPFNNCIVGVQNVADGAWPWQVSLQSPAHGGHFCGGSLINNNWILTAAHCVKGKSTSDLSVYLGKQILNGSNPNQIVKGVTEVVIHPDYNSATFNNDIALMALNSSVTFNSYITPVCLAGQGRKFLAGTKCWITGWGNTAIGEKLPYPGVLQEAMVPIVKKKLCNLLLGSVTPNMICAGHLQGGKDTCQGHSGGPLVSKQGEVWVQAGITSWGKGCGQPYKPGVYTLVSQYQSWISSIIKQNLPGFVTY